MSFRQPTPEELSELELLAKSLPGVISDYHALNHALRSYSFYQSLTPIYAEWVFVKAHEPTLREVPSFIIGSSTLGAYFPGTHEIWLNTDERYAGMIYGFTKRHELLHAENSHRHPDPVQNELLNRYATYSVTGDHAQLGPWAYR
jgi:hypothetical protein